MSDQNEHKRRQQRLALAEKFAAEVSTWPAKKLRTTYAQPDTVRRAEQRERNALQTNKKGD